MWFVFYFVQVYLFLFLVYREMQRVVASVRQRLEASNRKIVKGGSEMS